jgi:hypothetical protein
MLRDMAKQFKAYYDVGNHTLRFYTTHPKRPAKVLRTASRRRQGQSQNYGQVGVTHFPNHASASQQLPEAT